MRALLVPSHCFLVFFDALGSSYFTRTAVAMHSSLVKLLPNFASHTDPTYRTDVHIAGQHDNRALAQILLTVRGVLLQAARAHAVLH